MHSESHPKANQVVTLTNASDPHRGLVVNGEEFRVEDYWDRIGSTSWKEDVNTNPAAYLYYLRRQMADLPDDDEVVYGKINHLGHLVHVSEFE